MLSKIAPPRAVGVTENQHPTRGHRSRAVEVRRASRMTRSTWPPRSRSIGDGPGENSHDATVHDVATTA